jgi:hypothetical protein
MSPKRWRWTGLACLALSALTVGLGFLAQAVGVVLAILLFHVTIQVPVGAVGGAVGPTALPVPHILPAALFVAGLVATAALVSFFEATRPTRMGGPTRTRG